MDQQQIILRSRQLNPCDELFWKSRGYPSRPTNWQDLLEEMGYYDDDTSESENDAEESDDGSEYSDEESDNDDTDDEEYDSEEYEEHKNKSNNNNPNNDQFWIARGYRNGRPDNWRELLYGH